MRDSDPANTFPDVMLVPPTARAAAERAAPLTWVGEVVDGPPGARLSRAGSPVALRGYDHLR